MKAIDAEERKLSKQIDVPEPSVGHAIVRFYMPGVTDGGLIVPESAKQGVASVFVVKTSKQMIINGELIEHPANVGDRVGLMPNFPISALEQQLPEHHACVRLDYVTCYWPKSNENDPRLS